MPAMNVVSGERSLEVNSSELSCLLPGFRRRIDKRKISRKKFKYFPVCLFGLVCEKQVTRVLDQDEFCARNPLRNLSPLPGGTSASDFPWMTSVGTVI